MAARAELTREPGLTPGRASFRPGPPQHGRCGDRFRGTARPAWLVLAVSHVSNPAPARLCIALSGANLPGARYAASGRPHGEAELDGRAAGLRPARSSGELQPLPRVWPAWRAGSPAGPAANQSRRSPAHAPARRRRQISGTAALSSAGGAGQHWQKLARQNGRSGAARAGVLTPGPVTRRRQRPPGRRPGVAGMRSPAARWPRLMDLPAGLKGL